MSKKHYCDNTHLTLEERKAFNKYNENRNGKLQ